MCGIVGYTGKQSVAKQILDALELLEYRGYDSAGMELLMRQTVRCRSASVPEE